MSEQPQNIQVSASDAGPAGLLLSAALLLNLVQKGVLTEDEANGIGSRTYEALKKAGSPGGAEALRGALGATLKTAS